MATQQVLATDSKHSLSIAAIADKSWNRLAELAFKTGWSPIARLAESAVVAYVKKIIDANKTLLCL